MILCDYFEVLPAFCGNSRQIELLMQITQVVLPFGEDKYLGPGLIYIQKEKEKKKGGATSPQIFTVDINSCTTEQVPSDVRL